MSVGNKHLGYKDVLNAIEEGSPGSKSDLLLRFHRARAATVADAAEEEREGLRACPSCGAPDNRGGCAPSAAWRSEPAVSPGRAPVP